MKKKISILGCLMIILVSCSHNNKADSENNDLQLRILGDTVFVPATSPVLSKIKVETIEGRECNIMYNTTGTINPLSDCMAAISAPFEGRIVKSYVKLGQNVSQGSPLFELNSPDYFETIKIFLQAQQEKSLTEKNYLRKKDLNQNGVASKKDLEEAESAYQIAAKEYEKAGASLKVYNVRPSEVSIDKPLIVRSPIGGEVVKYNLPVGQYLKVDADPVLTIANLNKVWVVAHVKENKISIINKKDKVNVTTDAYPDKPVTGFVYYVGNMVDEQTRSVEVYVECENRDKILKPGMFSSVNFIHKTDDAIVIPESAVLQEENSCYLFVSKGNNVFIKKRVLTTSNGDKTCVVNSGVVSGDVIVAEGGVYLR
ncbi:MAG: efflux RND transporter periplasmic adaptor subunit [Bacteroidales bacterium]|nr:efflux RND transporter periplasmic adaptor subunit [Bacteroidales bacterium]